MSLARTALRIVTLEALKPTGAATFPTIAKAMVFDSAATPVDDLSEAGRCPVVVVYCDADHSAPAQPRGGPPFRRSMNLIFELSVVQFDEDEDNPGSYVPGIPVTDAETESSLDMLEAQIRFALLFGPTGELWRLLTGRKVSQIDSTSQRASEEAIRLALRTVTWRVETMDDCFANPNALPEPFASIFAALPASSYGAAIINGARPDLPELDRGTPLEAVAMAIRVKTPPAAQEAGETPHFTVEADTLP